MSRPDPVTRTTRGRASMPWRDAVALSAVAQEHAWTALWRRLLQPVPDDRPGSELHTNPDAEATEEEPADTASA
jgi:hypothetical protein